ncbi:MAG: sigma factor-like helix-turn-helix DNA-binding protein [Bryobacteraceae bacterium]
MEDLLQDTWLQIHRARHTYRAGEPVLPWIYDCATCESRWLSSETAGAIARTDDGFAAGACSPVYCRGADDRLSNHDRGAAPSQREVVTMLKVTGMSLQEVARATASTVGSVKLKAHRAYTRLRSELR